MGQAAEVEEAGKRRTCGRYELIGRVGKGGMASVYLARVHGELGFSRLYALKLLHPELATQKELVDMLIDEAHIASRLHHPNVVSTIDAGRDGDRYFTVMDYVEGIALDRLLRRHPDRRPPELIVAIAIDVLRGLAAAHELRDDQGHLLDLVHRDVTPGNVLVGIDGVARITDFGVAKARARLTKTNPGIVKGKAGYVAPETLLGREIDGRADVFSMGVLLWNALTGEALFDTDDIASTLTSLMKKPVLPPSKVGLKPPAIFDAPILEALHRTPATRHASAREMAEALSDALELYGKRAGPEQIGAWVRESFGGELEKRRRAAGIGSETPFDPDTLEPPSTSAAVPADVHGSRLRVEADDVHATPEMIEHEGRRRWGTIAVAMVVVLLALGGVSAWALTSRTPPPVTAGRVERALAQLHEAVEERLASIGPTPIGDDARRLVETAETMMSRLDVSSESASDIIRLEDRL
ncbi:MAG: serine/threonine protein kinase, partial [Sandaracinaceae bacterium]|nr:serine/threonine protein kinase [Sandaracinaceae bacterium]